MELLALVAWIVTALGGLTLAALWVAKGGLRRQDGVIADSYPSIAQAPQYRPVEGREGIPFHLVASHGFFALAGLVLWIAIIAAGETGDAGLPWVAFVLVLVVAGAGPTMFRRWQVDRRDRNDDPPEQAFSASVVYLHGLAALVTIVLVFLAAAGVGD